MTLPMNLNEVTSGSLLNMAREYAYAKIGYVSAYVRIFQKIEYAYDTFRSPYANVNGDLSEMKRVEARAAVGTEF